MDINIVKRTLEIFKPDNALIEIRSYNDKKIITSGYFKDNYNHLINGLSKMEATADACYFVFNNINDACYSKKQHEIYLQKPQTTTTDNDIISRSWLMIDADPKRATGISSTDEEKAKAKSTIINVYKYLRDIGFAYPIIADSGNGYHLMYKIELDNTAGATELIKTFLQSLDNLFSDDCVSIDTTVFNPSRITKLYGTMARKGANTLDRPHRLSMIIKEPEVIEKTSYVLIKKVADLLPKPIILTQKQNFLDSKFDTNDFIGKYLRVSRNVHTSMGTKHILENCPFDSSHKAPDSMISVLNNGAIGFKCFHNSCSDKTWQDVREMYEPKQQRTHDITRTNKPINIINEQSATEPVTTQTEKPKQYLQLHEIENIDRSQIVTLPTGIKILDNKIIGMNKKEVTIISGGNGSAKSTIIGQFILNHIECGFKSTIFSGELVAGRLKNWLHLQAAGRQYNKKSQYGENAYYTPKDIGVKIDEWAKGKLFIHNNIVGSKFSDVLNTIEQTISKEKTDIVYIDNLMAIDLSEVSGDKYERQTSVILRLVSIAKNYDVHIVFVCHPRKPMGFLRKEDISGTADLTNAVDNVIMCHRINRDFENNAKHFFDKTVISDFLDKQYTNCIEVMKNRDLGVQDQLIGMYFEPESKRLLNERHENKNFSWNDTSLFYSVDETIDNSENPFI